MGNPTLYILLPNPLQIHLCAKSPPHHLQTPAPGQRICHGVVFVQIALCEPHIHTLVRVHWILDLGLQPACANARRDALLDRPSLALYPQHLWPPAHTNCVGAGRFRPTGQMN